RTPLPRNLGSFDTFATDPPYTVAGCRLFVSRALERMTKDGTGMGFLCFGQSRSDLLAEVQKSLCGMGLVVQEMIPMFNRYLGCSVLANSSALFHLSVSTDAAPLIRDVYEGSLYTRDSKGKAKKYHCMKCKGEYEVGPGHPIQTIEALKEHGCSSCGGRKFKAYG
ncbi:MAG TPA: bis-aminopropyl spermidine synthase family protein, partial [bacterium]|nr:bis-aminopropyl spermidine synthase family protein [bacterium]